MYFDPHYDHTYSYYSFAQAPARLLRVVDGRSGLIDSIASPNPNYAQAFHAAAHRRTVFGSHVSPFFRLVMAPLVFYDILAETRSAFDSYLKPKAPRAEEERPLLAYTLERDIESAFSTMDERDFFAFDYLAPSSNSCSSILDDLENSPALKGAKTPIGSMTLPACDEATILSDIQQRTRSSRWFVTSQGLLLNIVSDGSSQVVAGVFSAAQVAQLVIAKVVCLTVDGQVVPYPLRVGEAVNSPSRYLQLIFANKIQGRLVPAYLGNEIRHAATLEEIGAIAALKQEACFINRS